MEPLDLRNQTERLCLAQAMRLLKIESTPTAETIGMAKELVEMALEIDALNLQWERHIRQKPTDFRKKNLSWQREEI